MADPIRRLSFDEVIDRLIACKKPYHKNYLAMYSNWYGGIILEPALMMIPIDDHLVHRGDGIFEAFKCVGGNIYGLEPHLDRLERSARGAQMELPVSREELVRIVLETIRAAGGVDCVIRLYVSRGPGGFTTNPYECTQRGLYVVATALHAYPERKYREGVRLITSKVPIKKDFYATIKSCNYLPNVLMKKEAEDLGVEFTVAIDVNGFLAEGGTENIGIITADRRFLVPRFDRIIRGITITRMMELARRLIPSGELKAVEEADITPQDAYGASEIMLFGTTFDVFAVVDYDGHTISEGKPGPIFKKFLELFKEDLRSGKEMLTPIGEL